MLVFADGRTVGTIGGGCYENEASLKAREVIPSGQQALLHFELNDDFAQENGLICGGQMDVHVDPLEPAPRLYIIGAGHVGWYLARLAGEMDYRVHVIDDREKFASPDRFPGAEQVVVEPLADWLHRADIPASAYVVIVTRGHQGDLEAMRALAARDLKYLGLIGSRAKVARIRDRAHGRRNADRVPRSRALPHRPRHRRRDAGRDCRQHPCGAHRRPPRRDDGASDATLQSLMYIPQSVRRASADSGHGDPRAMTTVIRNATILTLNDAREIVDGAVTVSGGRITAVGKEPDRGADRVIDARGGYLLPGFVQTHIHLCQTIFRSYADDMPLLEWLRRRIWPMEAAHTPATLRASARLAAAELLLSGTTTALTMETVHDTDVVFETLADVGLRATVGKCMMDSDSEVPARLREQTLQSIDESVALHKRWHGAAGGRLRAAFAPRFAVSCSRELLEAVGSLSTAGGILVHTHASESRDEVEVVRQLSGGLSNLEYLAATGLATDQLCAAHCVWVDRCGAGAAGGARRQGHALPWFEPEAGIRDRARHGHAPPRHLRIARRRRRGLQ